MRRLASVVATGGGLGYAPVAPGTFGSALGWIIGWFSAAHLSLGVSLAIWGAALWPGVWASTATERHMNRVDPSCVVVDEILGMWLVMLCLPLVASFDLRWGIAAFVVFRVFDVIKPPPLKRLARCPEGWGILLDDLGAAVYTGLALWAVWWMTHASLSRA